MPTLIEQFRLTRFQFPRSRLIGDSQVRADMNYIGTLELTTNDGHSGLGFFFNLFFPLPSLSELNRVFGAENAPALLGQSPLALLNRVSRPRGGNIRGSLFSQAIDQALWDLQGKILDLPLYRLLGGTNNRVPAYASGLDFHLATDTMQALFASMKERGFTAFKVKVGHPELRWDLARLRAVADVVGPEALLMVDANEAWTPKEAIRRLHAYRDAGLSIYWVEDPCLRDDFAGLAEIRRAVPFTHVNSGEYLDLHGKRQLLEQRAADIVNIHGHISESMAVARLAADYGVAISVGNTPLELGVHLAAALPEIRGMEYSFVPDMEALVEQAVEVGPGYLLAPERPGHGLVLSATSQDYAHAEP